MLIQSGNFESKTDVITCLHKDKREYEDHIHLYSELVYVILGELKVTVDGVSETAKAGDIIVIPPLAVHSYHANAYNEHWTCTFSNDFALDVITEKELYTGGEKHVFTPSDNLRYYISDRLIDGNEKHLTLTPELIRFFKATLSAIFDEYMIKVPIKKTERSYSYIISEVIKYMNNHYTESITLASVGKALGYSPKYISNCIGKIKGMNFCYILNSFRIENAKKLLRRTDLKVVDIAFECGFASDVSFRRAFLKMVQKKPLEYRKERRKKVINKD